MDKYRRVEKPKSDLSEIRENEVRITTQGKMRNYISYATNLLSEQVPSPPPLSPSPSLPLPPLFPLLIFSSLTPCPAPLLVWFLMYAEGREAGVRDHPEGYGACDQQDSDDCRDHQEEDCWPAPAHTDRQHRHHRRLGAPRAGPRPGRHHQARLINPDHPLHQAARCQPCGVCLTPSPPLPSPPRPFPLSLRSPPLSLPPLPFLISIQHHVLIITLQISTSSSCRSGEACKYSRYVNHPSFATSHPSLSLKNDVYSASSPMSVCSSSSGLHQNHPFFSMSLSCPCSMSSHLYIISHIHLSSFISLFYFLYTTLHYKC